MLIKEVRSSALAPPIGSVKTQTTNLKKTSKLPAYQYSTTLIVRGIWERLAR